MTTDRNLRSAAARPLGRVFARLVNPLATVRWRFDGEDLLD